MRLLRLARSDKIGRGRGLDGKSGNYQNLENRSKRRDSSGIVYIKSCWRRVIVEQFLPAPVVSLMNKATIN